MSGLIIGIDCGVTGAIAFLDEQGEYVHVEDLPISVYNSTKWVDASALVGIIDRVRLQTGDPNVRARALVEQTHAMPSFGQKCPVCKKGGNPTIANVSKGLTLGSTLGALQSARVSTEMKPPEVWKRSLGMLMPKATDKAKKDASLSRARMLFPMAPLERQKDHGRAEALLIAHWFVRYGLVASAA